MFNLKINFYPRSKTEASEFSFIDWALKFFIYL